MYREQSRRPTPGMGLCQQQTEVSHGAKQRVNGREVGHVVAKVNHGGLIHGTEPDGLHAQLPEVVQARHYPCMHHTHTVSTSSPTHPHLMDGVLCNMHVY